VTLSLRYPSLLNLTIDQVIYNHYIIFNLYYNNRCLNYFLFKLFLLIKLGFLVILGTAIPNYKTIFYQLLSAWPYKICAQNETYPLLINEILSWWRHFMFTFMCLQSGAKIRIGMKWLVDRKRRIALVMLSYHEIVW